MRKHKFFKAMSILEYTLLLAVVVTAFLGIQVYLKRAVSGRWKQSVDIFGFGRQYDGAKTTKN
jgi:hypothetical protein